ncbi:DUF4129 domain-containing protein [Cohnella nanjingensis]|uniref:DUF4129 domain-containing protein n=1 Tax=Cohnella nanjingensis TaxID=1387779 RepID=A0A7X0VFF2_9BACL|nr:DUF4129 domain-containing protein [Cohnella nanjingensis]MBB6670554.1 DUF4129 domain-containing protein [Cohnella nanjingensis]
MKRLMRSLAELLVWAPVLVTIHHFASGGVGLAVWFGAAWAAILVGMALPILIRRLPPALLHAVLLLALLGGAAYSDLALLPFAAALGVVSWIAGADLAWLWICGMGTGLQGVCLIVASLTHELSAERLWFILCGVGWFVALLYVRNAGMMTSAGLNSGIVTRSVAASSRKYLSLLVVVVLLVFLATTDLSAWHTIARWINALMPHGSPKDIAPEPLPSNEAQPPMFPEAGGSRHWFWRILDYIGYGLLGAAALFVCWLLLRRYLLNRAWLRSVAERVRSFMARLIRRREPKADDAGYTEERESLLNVERVLRRLQERWIDRGPKRLGRKEWAGLSPEARVRRLYEDTVQAGMREGFAHRPARTPAETVAELEVWQAGRSAARAERGGLWAWFAGARAALLELYGQARYGGREVQPGEVDRLAAEYPWEKK